ncbi:DNA topoisomerase 2-alpha-like isoform X2 [Dendronephthya gigantea]|nr:DNA topoisomerase 2-alpha-like isoform X2 [Dendronephthya gigantea]
MNAEPGKKPKKSNKRLSVERIYQKKTQLEHILLRPDAYIGSVEPTRQHMWVWDDEKKCMVNREISFVPGLYKIFDEILVNAADNKQRDPKMNYIKINIDPENNMISVQNNGRGIPIEMHRDEKMYVPSMIFGHLLTSSNYDDSQKKVTGGRNGYGAKLCNIYSTEFTVETVCDSKHFKQTWKKNMTKTADPKIKETERNDYTSIAYHPDLAKFKMEKLDKDTVALMTKRAYDVAGCVRGVNVYLNGKKLPISSFRDYMELYLKDGDNDSEDESDGKRKIVHEKVNSRWEVAVTVSNKGFQQASFVNSIATTKGGTHVNYVADQVIEKLMGVIKKKAGKGSVAVKNFQVKNHLWIFINCLVENPAFDSQTKENMTLRAKDFGSQCVLGDKFVKEVTQCGVVENILDWVKVKTQTQLKKNSGGKHSKLKGIPKLDDANDAGGKNSRECTLILTEGDSAKTLAVSGLSVVGRDRYGVFPLRGKLLNVREATHKQVVENAEINNIVKIMGLTYGKKYRTVEDMKSLRYGRLMIMTDQDQDGSHIKGLLINFIHHNWPELLQLPFLEEFITPIVKASKGKEEIPFYSIPEFDEWKERTPNAKSWKIKYYKGLGTSTPKEAKEYFADMNRHRILFDYSGIADDEAITLAFSKKKVADRKTWLSYQLEERKTRKEAGLPEVYLYGPGTKRITYTDFVNKELILFSNADNERSIPSIVDGLKPGQRKVLFTCFKRNDKREVKVAQLAGSVAELSAYHHGEQSLAMTIVNLAQNFVGSNNLNLLMPIGQFGTRIHGGKDSASTRYIFTKLSPLARLVFPQYDDNVLNFLVEDNQMIEPEWYCPIIPMALVNGADGIGTGYSTKIPNFDIRELAQYIKDMLNDRTPSTLHPCYKNFTGEINQTGHQKYEVLGRAEVLDEKSVDITELPVGTWTQNYKEATLEVMLHGTVKYKGCITDYKEYHTDTTVHFKVTMAEEDLTAIENQGLKKKFNLTSSINLSNMVLFDAYGALKKFESVDEIIREYYRIRFNIYVKRKEFLEGMLAAEAEKLTAQARFILEKIDGTIIIENKKKRDVVTKLVERGYPSDPVKIWKDSQKRANVVVEETDDDDSRSETGSVSSTSSSPGSGPDYAYLLSMAILSLSKEKKDELLKQRDDKRSELATLRSKTPKDLWLEDLDRFLEGLEAVEAQEREDALAGSKVVSRNKSGRSSKVSKPRKPAAAKPKNSIEKAFAKQAANVKTSEKEIAREEKAKDDWGFSDESENQDMLSLTERLALKKFEDTSDAASSVNGKQTGKKPATSGISGTKAKKSKVREMSDSESSVASNVAKNKVKKLKSPAKRKAAAKKEIIDIDSDSSVGSVASKTSKPPAKKARTSGKTKASAAPKRPRDILASSDEDSDVEMISETEPVSPVKRPARRQKPAVKYTFGEDEEDGDNQSRDASSAEEDWMDSDDNDDDSDFDL